MTRKDILTEKIDLLIELMRYMEVKRGGLDDYGWSVLMGLKELKKEIEEISD